MEYDDFIKYMNHYGKNQIEITNWGKDKDKFFVWCFPDRNLGQIQPSEIEKLVSLDVLELETGTHTFIRYLPKM